MPHGPAKIFSSSFDPETVGLSKTSQTYIEATKPEIQTSILFPIPLPDAMPLAWATCQEHFKSDLYKRLTFRSLFYGYAMMRKQSRAIQVCISNVRSYFINQLVELTKTTLEKVLYLLGGEIKKIQFKGINTDITIWKKKPTYLKSPQYKTLKTEVTLMERQANPLHHQATYDPTKHRPKFRHHQILEE